MSIFLSNATVFGPIPLPLQPFPLLPRPFLLHIIAQNSIFRKKNFEFERKSCQNLETKVFKNSTKNVDKTNLFG